MSPLFHTLSNAFSTSINMAAEWCLIFLALRVDWVSWKILSLVDLCLRKPDCCLLRMLLLVAQFVSLSVIIFSKILLSVLINEMGR